MSADRWLEQHPQAVRLAMGVLAVGMVSGGVWTSEQFFNLASANTELRAQNAQLSSSLNTSQRQLQANGIVPVAPTAQAITAKTPKPTSTVAPGPVNADLALPVKHPNRAPQDLASLLYFVVYNPQRKY
jgi:hypothetical protein